MSNGNGNGNGNIKWIAAIITMAVVMAVAMTMIAQLGNGASIDRLEGAGFTVIAKADYDELNAKIDALKVSADAAVVNAEIAAAYANETLTVLRLHTENEGFLFPAVTNVVVTLTAPATPNTWGAWAEIAGNDTVTFSSKFAASGGYVTQITGYEYSVADKLIIIELAYDDDGTDVVGRVMMRSDFTWVLELNSAPIPAGSTIYYRMMSNQANETIKANFKYYYD